MWLVSGTLFAEFDVLKSAECLFSSTGHKLHWIMCGQSSDSKGTIPSWDMETIFGEGFAKRQFNTQSVNVLVGLGLFLQSFDC